MFDPAYSGDVFDARTLKVRARQTADALTALQHRLGFQAIVVQGKSGISMAFASAMLHDIPIVVVRKDNEGSHGSSIEGRTLEVGGPTFKYLILDDFISTGRTCVRIVDKLHEYLRNQTRARWSEALDRYVSEPFVTGECVGILGYLADVEIGPFEVKEEDTGKRARDYLGSEGYTDQLAGVPYFGCRFPEKVAMRPEYRPAAEMYGGAYCRPS